VMLHDLTRLWEKCIIEVNNLAGRIQ